jgi:hypothetical protein
VSTIVPRFSQHGITTAVLTEDSWREIFGSATPEKGRNNWHGHRKIARVRLARRDGLMVPQGDIQGLFFDPKHYWRRVYGVVLFQTQHDVDPTVPLIMPFQLRVGMGLCYHGDITSISMYFTPKTRMEERTYYVRDGKALLGAFVDVKESDYEFGLMRTRKMFEWNYCPPPLKIGD